MRDDEIAAKRWLRQLRDDSGLSQAALAEAVGTSRRTVLNAESEREDAGWPNGFTLLRMLQELGVVTGAAVQTDRPLARLEASVAESVALTREAIQLLREARGQADGGRRAQRSAG